MSLNHGFDRISSCPNCRVKAADLFDHPDFIPMTQVQKRAPGEMLFEENRAPLGVYLVDSGRVKLSRTADARLQVVKVARTGDVLGLGATLTNRLHQVTGQVLTDTVVRFYPIEEFHRFLKRHGMYLGRLVMYLEEHAHHDEAPFTITPAAVRVASFLLDTAHRDGRETPEGLRVDLPVTFRELSSVLIVPPDRLEDVLDRFEDHHWVYRGSRSVTVLEESALTAISRGAQQQH